MDASGNLYATGASTSGNFPVTAGAFQIAYSGPVFDEDSERIVGDAFVVKLKPDGSGLVYGTFLGGSSDDHGNAIAVDAAGNVFVAGSTASTNFPLTADATKKNYAGGGGEHNNNDLTGDGFLAVLNPAGTKEVFATYLGGSLDDTIQGLAIDAADNIFVTGVTMSTDFPVTSGAFQSKFGGVGSVGRVYGDAFVAKFSAPNLGTIISQVSNAEGGGAALAPNTWAAIYGLGLSPDSRLWQSSDFVNNQMPTALDGVKVTMNGTPAYVYYISPNQINVLTPPNLAAGAVQLVVTNGTTASNTFTATAKSVSPSFFVFGSGPYLAAVHPSGSYLYVGPTALYPGSSSPAAPGETIELFGNGFGATDTAVTAGSQTQSGSLPVLPVVTIGGVQVTPSSGGLISPGLYQFNVQIPSSLPSGDASISATYNGATTQSGTLITIK